MKGSKLLPRPALEADSLEPIARSELPTETIDLARYLVGKQVVRSLAGGVVSGIIVETEAYVVDDPACHAFRGMTPRNGSLFLELGHAYVYQAYGISWLLNVSSEGRGIGAGVLIRALEPVLGIEIMKRNRATERLRDLARGPGRLTQAMEIDRRLDGIDLCRPGALWLAHAPTRDGGCVGRSVRIGITKAADRPLRFFLRGSPFVSGPRALNVN